MAGNRDDSNPGETDTIPIDAVPEPVLGYDRSADGAVITTTNEAFDTAFATTSVGTPVERWLRSDTAADQPVIGDVCSSLVETGQVDTTVRGHGDTEYRLQSLTPPGDRAAADGYVRLTERQHNGTIGADHIASLISHDLRNPLDVANAHLQAARETGGADHFDEIRDSHERMERIITDVLELTRGQQPLDITAGVDLETVATDAWSRVDTDGVSLELGDELPTCAADTDQVQRLFENLFRNSVEHGRPGVSSGDGPDELRVSVGATPDGFFVADDGTGIPAADHERVFDPGYSSDETGRGTGLGLTIVEQIARAHGWSVTLSTGPAGGARFEFRLTSRDSPQA